MIRNGLDLDAIKEYKTRQPRENELILDCYDMWRMARDFVVVRAALAELEAELRRLLEVVPRFPGDTWNEPIPEHLAFRDRGECVAGYDRRFVVAEGYPILAARVLQEAG